MSNRNSCNESNESEMKSSNRKQATEKASMSQKSSTLNEANYSNQSIAQREESLKSSPFYIDSRNHRLNSLTKTKDGFYCYPFDACNNSQSAESRLNKNLSRRITSATPVFNLASHLNDKNNRNKPNTNKEIKDFANEEPSFILYSYLLHSNKLLLSNEFRKSIIDDKSKPMMYKSSQSEFEPNEDKRQSTLDLSTRSKHQNQISNFNYDNATRRPKSSKPTPSNLYI
jgi:hypothetical protein